MRRLVGRAFALLLVLGGCARPSPPVRPLDGSVDPARPLPEGGEVSGPVAPDGSASGDGAQPTAEPGWLGVELALRPSGEPGVLVRGVVPDSPAQRAGLAPGDVILSLDGERADRPADLVSLVVNRAAGDRVGIVFLRDGNTRLASATLEALPSDEAMMQKRFVDAEAPGLTALTTVQGSIPPTLTALRGKVVIVEFWAEWCLPCRILAPVLSEWSDRYGARGMTVLGVTSDPVITAADAARRNGMSYAVFSDETGATQRAYRAYSLPTLFVIDRRGVVRDVMVGFSAARLRAIETLVERLLAEG
ncbi:MAG: redoxin domain-containing protein [Pseudomonadota bacterium]|nr:MAG: hypothetical protein DIU78_06165 [Pseudomonadota bacterium]